MLNLDDPVHLETAKEGGFVVTFPDVPEAITQGEDEDEALLRAVDALETALSFYIDDRRPLPVPAAARPVRAPVRAGKRQASTICGNDHARRSQAGIGAAARIAPAAAGGSAV